MKVGLLPEVCSGTYLPRRGKPQQQYFVVLDEIVLAGPFRTKREAAVGLRKILRRSVDRMIAQPKPTKGLQSKYMRSILSVLREQEKALSAVLGAAS